MENDLHAVDVNWKAARSAIEYRIRQRKDNITHEFYGIGDDLNEAKQRGMIGHGEWESWATDVTGLAIRTVQRLMQAAREIPPEKRLGSSLGQLEFRQLSAVLALPEGEREAMADRAVAQGMSSREVEEAVRKAKSEAAEAIQAAERKASLAESGRIGAVRQKGIAERELRAKDALIAETQQQVAELQSRLLAAKQAAPTGAAAGREQEETIRSLQNELLKAQTFAREQAKQRQNAQQQLLALQSQNARDIGVDEPAAGLTVAQFAESARAFVGRCGALPHMRAQLSTIRQKERDEWESSIAMVQQLLDGAREALNCVEGGLPDEQ
ncbi:MAG: DUF3102 domain-containing protein [Eubacteriales bacterium]|nr:DUF3102 domain-containing protein [Eubacteriales bacterium]